MMGFFAIGNDELENLPEFEGEEAKCPHCHEMHKVTWGRDESGNPERILGGVHCPVTNEDYLVVLRGKLLD